MSENKISGSCLCGRVSYHVKGHLGIFQYCHCSRCRKFTGSAFAASLMVKPQDFAWSSGSESVGRYEPEGVKHFATSFCKHCGSSLPWLAQSAKVVVIPAGTLDDDPGIKPFQNIYCASGASWFTQPSDLPQFDELPEKH